MRELCWNLAPPPLPYLKDGMEGEGEEQHEGAEGAVLEHTVRDVAVVGMPIVLMMDLEARKVILKGRSQDILGIVEEVGTAFRVGGISRQ